MRALALSVWIENETTTGLDFAMNRWYRIRLRVTESPRFEAVKNKGVTAKAPLIELLRRHHVQLADLRQDRSAGLVLVSEGGVGVSSRHGDASPKARVSYLFPHEYKRA